MQSAACFKVTRDRPRGSGIGSSNGLDRADSGRPSGFGGDVPFNQPPPASLFTFFIWSFKSGVRTSGSRLSLKPTTPPSAMAYEPSDGGKWGNDRDAPYYCF